MPRRAAGQPERLTEHGRPGEAVCREHLAGTTAGRAQEREEQVCYRHTAPARLRDRTTAAICPIGSRGSLIASRMTRPTSSGRLGI